MKLVWLLLLFSLLLATLICQVTGKEVEEELRDGSKPLLRVKRKKGGIFKSKSSSKSRNPSNTNPYPKQPAYNPSYNPNTNANFKPYPQQPNYNPNVKPNYNPGGFNPGSYGTGIGGMGSGYKQKGVGGLLGGGTGKAVLAGAAGAAGGLWLGHKIGQMTHSFSHPYNYYGRHNMDEYYRNPYAGYYGYYDGNRMYHKCPPPPRIVNINGTLFIPYEENKGYDSRCQYYERDPMYSPYTYGTAVSSLEFNKTLISAIVFFALAVNSLVSSHLGRTFKFL